MATFALIHGGGSSAWDWHLVTPLLERAGHDAVAVDLPIEDDAAALEDYAEAVVDAVGKRRDVIVVGHSLGGFTAPLAAERLEAIGLVYLAAMIPAPGETFEDWWSNTGHSQETIDPNPDVSFFNGVPDALAQEAKNHERDQHGSWMRLAWPGTRHPNVRTIGIVFREDKFFPAEFMRRQIRERLGSDPVETVGGHYAALSHPKGVAEALLAFATEITP